MLMCVSAYGNGLCDDVANNIEAAGTNDLATSDYALGADISWVTEMEADGKKFYNAAGTETDCFALMKELGFNAIRLRVWVNPENFYGPYSDKADVVKKAVRAKEAGMDVMIDFHYSDIFADPQRQQMPEAWAGFSSLSELANAVSEHTKDVLGAVVAAGVTPKWVQVGNETRYGMMWPVAKLCAENADSCGGWRNYAYLSNAGYDAVKAILPNAIVIIHIDNAWDDNAWWFDNFLKYGGKMDMIGLSHYPQTNPDKPSCSEMNRLALAHIKSLAAAYGVKVMVAEVGVKQSDEELAATVLAEFMDEARKMTDVCAGVFYWEPQIYGYWRPAIYETLNWNSYDMGAFSMDGRPAKALDAFK